MPDTPFSVGISADFLTDAPGQIEPVWAELMGGYPQISYAHFGANGHDAGGAFVLPEDIAGFDAVLLMAYRFTAASFTGSERLATIARWGVGYDRIDVPACTAAGVLLAITPQAVRRPVAEAVVTLILALAKHLFDKDRLVRANCWERSAYPGLGLAGKTLGTVGIGNIGADVFRLLAPFELGLKLAFDPYVDPAAAAHLGVELVDLETVFRMSDFVTINAPLTAETKGLVNARLLGMMQPTAFLINTARGGLVVQEDLVAALQKGKIAGAGLDVFAEEPLPPDHPLTRLDNVILAPHSLAWTDQLYRDNGVQACLNILSVLAGEAPLPTVNQEVQSAPAFQDKLAALHRRWEESVGE